MSDELKLNKYLSNPSKELLDKIYPNIESKFQSKSNTLQVDIRRFIDKNNEILFASTPSFRLYFSDIERDKIYNYFGMTKREIEIIIKEDKTVEKSWMFMRPFELSCILLIRYYQNKKMKKQMENLILYLALSLYAGVHYNYFPYPPNENIMNYTINNLSNKYKIKQFGNILESIKDVAMVNHNTYTKYLDKGTDVLLNLYVDQLRSRLNNFMKNIASEYYKNQQSGNYLNTEEDNYDDDNYYVVENDSFAIEKITNNVTNRIITKGIDLKICKLSANMCTVSVSDLQKTLQNIIYNRDKEIKNFVNLILQLYLNDPDNNIQKLKGKHFVEYCLKVYIKSNTKDKNIIEIRKILDIWLMENSTLYVKTNRVATKNNLRKAVYLYVIFMIQQEVIRM